MKALIVGATGQLGHSLIAMAPKDATIVALGPDDIDITDQSAVAKAVHSSKPDVVFNAAAYTAVDKAESEEKVAHAVNATAVGYLSEAAAAAQARLVHVSTDFVFDGMSGSPYPTAAPTNPLGVYGRTKRDGEVLAGRNALIVRTAWVYGPHGANFVRTMLRLMSERPEVRVVSDQVGSPTYAPGLAAALWQLAGQKASGMHHYTDAGIASWYDFAVAIQEEGLAARLLDHAVPIVPISTSDFPKPARRPSYSVLDKSSTWAALGGPAPHWRSNLRRMMSEISTFG